MKSDKAKMIYKEEKGTTKDSVRFSFRKNNVSPSAKEDTSALLMAP
jgi:hypothetical protein